MTKFAHIWTEQRQQHLDDDDSPFDRIAFTMRALRLVKPRTMTVAVLEGRSAVRTDSGRDLGGGADASWGIVSVPPHASRVDIAMAVASLAGGAGDPYLLDIILRTGPWMRRS